MPAAAPALRTQPSEASPRRRAHGRADPGRGRGALRRARLRRHHAARRRDTRRCASAEPLQPLREQGRALRGRARARHRPADRAARALGGGAGRRAVRPGPARRGRDGDPRAAPRAPAPGAARDARRRPAPDADPAQLDRAGLRARPRAGRGEPRGARAGSPEQIPLLVLAMYHVVVGYFTIASLYRDLERSGAAR